MVERVNPLDVDLRGKFDLQLGQADVRENDLARRLAASYGSKIELKSERYIWERTGNICIEFERNGQPSGIAITTAEWWAHELVNKDEQVVMTLFLPVKFLKARCRDLWVCGRWVWGGDGNLSKCFTLPIRTLHSDMLRLSR